MAETYNDINLKSLVFNKVTNEEYRQMVQNGTIKDDEFYITPSELIDVPNIDSTTSGKYLTNDGTGALWSDVQSTNVVQDLSNPSADTVLSSQGVANESSRIMSIMDTKQDKSTAVNYNNITNCITEIPQDIKLELNNGTLTLKAGSKVYKGDGTVVNITGDIIIHSGTLGSQTSLFMVFIDINNVAVRVEPKFVASGNTNPGSGYYVWFDTSNKVIKQSNSADGNFTTVLSLPIGIYQRTNGVATRIDQVFNGFGYIGSTVFALPGVKGLIPNGRNADGSLKNIELVVSTVQVHNNITASSTIQEGAIVLDRSGYPIWRNWLGTSDSTLPIKQYWSYYNQVDNQNYFAETSTQWKKETTVLVGFFNAVSGKITTFTPKTVFHAVDYNDFADLKDTVDTINSNVVHKTGDETIAGRKTFEGTINSKSGVNFVNSTITKGTNPSSSQYWAFRFNDKTNSSTWSATRLGVIEGCLDTSGNTSLYFGTYKNEASSTASAFLKVGYNLTSGAYAQAPTPAVSSNGTNIATTAYVNNKFQVVSTLPANPDGNVYYFIPE